MRTLRPLALAGLALLAACQGGSSGMTAGAGRTDGFPAPDREIVFDVAAATLRQQGWSIEVESSNPATGQIQTRWRTALAPFSGQGTRDRATVWVRDVPGRPNYYVVEANVTRETNMEIVQPGNPLRAKWEQPTRMTDLEAVIVRQVEAYFLRNDASRGLQERYGTGGAYDPRLRSPTLQGDPAPSGR